MVHGYNESEIKRPNLLYQIIVQFMNPLTAALIFIAVFSFIMGQKVTAVLIISMAIIGALLSFVQESRAERNAKKLREMVKIFVQTRRDNKTAQIPLREIVPGDIVELSAGDLIPADLLIIKSKDLHVNEAAISGESFPVEKNDNSEVFMGSSIANGTAIGQVTQTGLKTKFGKLFEEVISVNKITSFDKGVQSFVSLMLKVILSMTVLIFVINFFGKNDLFSALFFALAVAVGLVPEMLPMLIAVNLSKGAMRLAKRKIITKRLNSIQNFGAMDILCTDKTGTLTEDSIVLIKHCDVDGKEDEGIFELAYLNSALQTGFKNVLDEAIKKHGDVNLNHYKKIDEIPFDYERRIISIIASDSSKVRMISKGSPEELIDKCTHYEIDGKKEEVKDQERLVSQYKKLSQEGYRVIGIAYKEVEVKEEYSIQDENNLILKGFVALLDPPKNSVKNILKEMQEIGINLKILTGDNELVTEKICREVNFRVDNIISGKEIEGKDENELKKIVESTNVFVKVDPLQKERIVKTLQSNGHIVGFLGDGINDAPAIRNSDVGISVNNAADIAKETADVILLEKDLTCLKECVEEGRRTFGNFIKYVKMGASSNFGNMFSMAGASLILPFLPLLPIQIILNNFLYDFCQLTIPYDKVDQEYLKTPKPWNIKFISKFMITFGIVSSLFDFLTFGVLWFIFNAQLDLFRTGWFLESLATQTLVIHIIRTRKVPFLESRPSLILLLSSLLVVIVGFILPFTSFASFLSFSKPSFLLILTLIFISILYLIVVQVVKNIFVRKEGFD